MSLSNILRYPFWRYPFRKPFRYAFRTLVRKPFRHHSGNRYLCRKSLDIPLESPEDTPLESLVDMTLEDTLNIVRKTL